MTAPGAVCAWCGRSFDERAERLAGRTRCAACGVATTDPWPTDDELDAAYAGWYRPVAGRFLGLGDALLRRSRGSLARRLDRRAPPGRILDVGAGAGDLIDALTATGREAVGLERSSPRPDILEGDLSDVSGTFAAVVFWHTLEHLARPGLALARATELLTPRGLLVVALPNADSLQARAFGERWFALDLPRHLVHVPERALTARLAELGLTVERSSHLRGGQVLFGWLHGLAGKLTGGLDLYDAIRRPEARQRPMRRSRRLAALACAAVAAPGAAVMAAVEVLLRRGGTVYVEGRRA